MPDLATPLYTYNVRHAMPVPQQQHRTTTLGFVLIKYADRDCTYVYAIAMW